MPLVAHNPKKRRKVAIIQLKITIVRLVKLGRLFLGFMRIFMILGAASVFKMPADNRKHSNQRKMNLKIMYLNY